MAPPALRDSVKKNKISISRSQLRVSRTSEIRQPKRVVIEISVENDKIKVGPGHGRVRLLRGVDDIVWKCKAGLFVVHFGKNGCPFESVMFAAPKNQSIGSGPASMTGSYGYSIWVWAKRQGPPLYLDPIVDVDDGRMGQTSELTSTNSRGRTKRPE